MVVILIMAGYLVSGEYRPTRNQDASFILMILLILIIGTRRYMGDGVGAFFGDTMNYSNSFIMLKEGHRDFEFRDFGFGVITTFFVKLSNARLYFLSLTAMYIFSAWYAIRRLSLYNTIILFIMFIGSMLFWSNGVNGIRSGVASSFLLIAFTFPNKNWFKWMLFVLAISFHKSMILPAAAYVLAMFYKDSRGYLAVWVLSILLSLSLGGFWETFFAGFNIGDERFSEYLTSTEYANQFSSTGFRWDFLVFSAVPVILGIHYIYQKNYTNQFYIHLFNTYLLANSFWILVIRASFSNRFASLSWFLMSIIILLPLLKRRIWIGQHEKIALILILNYAFTYYMVFDQLWK